MTLIIQLAVVFFMCYSLFVTIAAVVSLANKDSDTDDIGMLLLTVFGFVCLVILYIQNPDKKDFEEKIKDEFASSTMAESKELLELFSNLNILDPKIEQGIIGSVDKVYNETVREISEKYVKRTNYILFSVFTINAPFDKKSNVVGAGGYYFNIDPNSALNDFIQ